MAGSTAVISPHLDDAALSCAQVILEHADVTVVNVFTGAPEPGRPPGSWDRITGATDAVERMRERVAEDAAVLQGAGARVVNLGFRELEYRDATPDLRPVRRALARAVAGTTHVYVPAGIAGHPDHGLTSRAALALSTPGVLVTVYAEVPYACEHGWPEWVDGAPEPNLDATAHIQHGLPRSVRAEDADVRTLDASTRERKLAMCRGYATQFPALDEAAGGALSRGDALHHELYWPLGPRPRSRRQRAQGELLWHAGVRPGSTLDRLSRKPGARRMRMFAGRLRRG